MGNSAAGFKTLLIALSQDYQPNPYTQHSYTHARKIKKEAFTSSIRFCFSSRPFLAVFVKETFLSHLDLSITVKTCLVEDPAAPSVKFLAVLLDIYY